ncbi:MAG TPA: DUF378 domain-containing protein [Candidatus Paceibacterota bacterium]|nr:DUF378 domain-containing protein [Candidatus Paceibacterota bacterium]
MCSCKNSWWYKAAKVLVIIGGINWGLIGVSMLINSQYAWNLVAMLFGRIPVLVSVVYLLVGISALVVIFAGHCCKTGNKACCQVTDPSGSTPNL